MCNEVMAVFLKREAFIDMPMLTMFVRTQGYIKCAKIDKELHYLNIQAVREEEHKVITVCLSVPHALVNLILTTPASLIRDTAA